MIACKSCGSVLNDGEPCTKCEKQSPPPLTSSTQSVPDVFYCTSCGRQRGKDAAFCPSCGASTNLALATTAGGFSSTQTVPTREDAVFASQVAMGAAAVATRQRLAANTCPNCMSGMVAVAQRSKFGLLLFLFGCAIVWVPFVGWLFGSMMIITGLFLRWGRKPTLYYQCPGCNYSNR